MRRVFYAYRTNMSLAQAGPIAPSFGELSSVCQAVHRDDAELRLADLLDAVEGDVSQPELAVAQADGLTEPCSKESCGRRSDYEVRASAHILPIIHTNQRFSLNSIREPKRHMAGPSNVVDRPIMIQREDVCKLAVSRRDSVSKCKSLRLCLFLKEPADIPAPQKHIDPAIHRKKVPDCSHVYVLPTVIPIKRTKKAPIIQALAPCRLRQVAVRSQSLSLAHSL